MYSAMMRFAYLLLILVVPLFAHWKPPFYHENGQVAWFGVNNPDSRFFYRNGTLAWDGVLDPCIVYHSNGEKACGSDPRTIYHSNGEIAWKGYFKKDCPDSPDDCVVYHRNRNVAWRGSPGKNHPIATEACAVYHANGAVAWRGHFSRDTDNLWNFAVFHDNYQIAWEGRQGDPIYDRDGKLFLSGAESITMTLGDDSWLYVSQKGTFYLHLSLGDQSFLSFSNQDQNPRLLMHLGQGINLELFPYAKKMPQLTLFGFVIPVAH